jgi:hypothetical protein
MTSECIPMLKNRRGKHVGIEMIQGAGVHSYVNMYNHAFEDHK